MGGTTDYLVTAGSGITTAAVLAAVGGARRWARGLGTRLDAMESRITARTDGLAHEVDRLAEDLTVMAERVTVVETVSGLRNPELGAGFWARRRHPEQE